MEESTDHACENGVPAPQAEQRIEQRVFHVINSDSAFTGLAGRVANGDLNWHDFGWARDDPIATLRRGRLADGSVGKAKLASKTRQHAPQPLSFFFAFWCVLSAKRKAERFAIVPNCSRTRMSEMPAVT